MKRFWLLLIFILCQLIIFVAPFKAMWFLLTNNEQGMMELLKGYDRLGNVTLNGESKETISSRANRARSEHKAWGCVLCRFLDFVQPNHCKDSENV